MIHFLMRYRFAKYFRPEFYHRYAKFIGDQLIHTNGLCFAGYTGTDRRWRHAQVTGHSAHGIALVVHYFFSIDYKLVLCFLFHLD